MNKEVVLDGSNNDRTDGCLLDAGLEAADINCMGITTQRNTFITWDKYVVHKFELFLFFTDL